jgi:hypothetical protein
MALKFNPLTGNFDFTGSGGGGGSSYIDGEVQNFSALPETLGTPAVDSAYLVREAEGTWLLARKPAGIYIRTANTGVRADDWTHAGAFPDVFNDANFLLYDNDDSTKNLAFQLSGITAGATRTITVPDANITIENTGHAAKHHTGGTDAIAPNNISAQWELVPSGQFIAGDTVLSSGRNRRITLSVVTTANVDLPYENNVNGDVVALVKGQTGAATATIRRADALSGGVPFSWSTLATLTTVGQGFTFVSDGTATGWTLRGVDTHAHAASDVTTGTFDNDRINFAAPAAIGSTTPNTLAGTELALHDGSDTGTFVAASKLTANRTYDLPNASGTLALASDLPKNLWIPASAWIPKTTAGCGVDSRETTTNDQNFDELLFDTGTDEFADALVVMPSNYNNGTITARFYWTAASGSGGVAWAIQGRAFANDDALDTAAGTAQLVTDTLIAADDMHITSATSAVTIGGTPAANTPIQFTIYRDVSDAADDLAVDARLLGVEIIFN